MLSCVCISISVCANSYSSTNMHALGLSLQKLVGSWRFKFHDPMLGCRRARGLKLCEAGWLYAVEANYSYLNTFFFSSVRRSRNAKYDYISWHEKKPFHTISPSGKSSLESPQYEYERRYSTWTDTWQSKYMTSTLA
jgi:hypothetical protein